MLRSYQDARWKSKRGGIAPKKVMLRDGTSLGVIDGKGRKSTPEKRGKKNCEGVQPPEILQSTFLDSTASLKLYSYSSIVLQRTVAYTKVVDKSFTLFGNKEKNCQLCLIIELFYKTAIPNCLFTNP